MTMGRGRHRAGSQNVLMPPPGWASRREREGVKGRQDRDTPKSFFSWEDWSVRTRAAFLPPIRPKRTSASNERAQPNEPSRHRHEEGLTACSPATIRHAEATLRAVRGLGAAESSAATTGLRLCSPAILMPAGHASDAFRKGVLGKFDMSLGRAISIFSAKCSARTISATPTTSPF